MPTPNEIIQSYKKVMGNTRRIIIEIDVEKDIWDKDSINEISKYFIHNYGSENFNGRIIEAKNPPPMIPLDISEKVHIMKWVNKQ